MKTADKGKVEQVEEICTIQAEHLQYRNKFTLMLNVEKVEIVFEIDSGAAVTLLGYEDFKRYFPNFTLQETNIKLTTYCKRSLKVMGFASVNVKN